MKRPLPSSDPASRRSGKSGAPSAAWRTAAAGILLAAQAGAAPLFTVHPAGQREYSGTHTVIEARAKGATAATSWMWLHNGLPADPSDKAVTGHITAPPAPDGEWTVRLTFERLDSRHAGVWQLRADDQTGTAFSRTAQLYVLGNDAWAGSPDDQFFWGNPRPLPDIMSVTAVAPEADGSSLIAFQRTDQTASVMRLHSDGTPDPLFASGTAAGLLGQPPFGSSLTGSAVHRVLRQDDGWIVAGNFLTWNGRSATGLIRLRHDGTVDPAFHEPVLESGGIHAMLVDTAGRILIAGGFQRVNGTPRPQLARLNPDGSLDTAFVPPALNGYVLALALTPDGTRLLAGGRFTTPSVRLLRMDAATGAADFTFFDSRPFGGEVDVRTITVLPAGNIVIGGGFTRFQNELQNGVALERRSVALLTPDGRVDRSFNADFERDAGPVWWVGAAFPEGTGTIGPGNPHRILIAGDFRRNRDLIRAGLTRTDLQGNPDPEFRPPPLSRPALACSVDLTGSILCGGLFSWPQNRLMRLRGSIDREAPVDVLIPPQGFSVPRGAFGCLWVNAGGEPPLNYRWFRNGVPQDFLTTPEVLLLPASDADTGQWSVEVSNARQTLITSTVPVSVTPAEPPADSVRVYSTVCRLAIPRNISASIPGTVECALTVPEDFPVSDVNVRLHITGVETNDIGAVLIPPGNQAARVLFAQPAHRGTAFNQTVFDSDSPLTYAAVFGSSPAAGPDNDPGEPPYPGSYQPQDSLDILPAGRSGGVWKLRVTNSDSDSPQGMLVSWGLEFTGAAPMTWPLWRDAAYPPGTLPEGDADRDGLTNFTEYALPSRPEVSSIGPQGTVVSCRRRLSTDLSFSWQLSTDLRVWRDAVLGVDYQPVRTDTHGDTTETVTIRIAAPDKARYFRVAAMTM